MLRRVVSSVLSGCSGFERAGGGGGRGTRRAAAGAFALAVMIVAALLTPQAHADVGLERVATGLDHPMYVTAPPGDTDRLFIAEKGGIVKILNLNTGTVNATPFLTIGDTDEAGDGGLQSIAFHPDYASNGQFYVHVTVDNGGLPIDNGTSPFSSHIRGYTVSGDPTVANPAATEVINWVQPRSNHNGGWIGFNPKVAPNDPQYLYVMSGDGGKQRDPDNNALSLDDPLGKILRIDVDGDDFPGDANLNYAVPGDNPFKGVGGALDEIWAYGLRNPWRASFDRDTADLWNGDVGQNAREEINFQAAASAGGENYAWNRREGLIAHQNGALLPGDVEPVYDYSHGTGSLQGRSVVGGYVHRGPVEDLRGLYVFADTISNHFWTFDPADPLGTVQNIDALLVPDVSSVSLPVSFGEDAVGNLYIVDFGFGPGAGEIFKIIPEPAMGAMVALGCVALMRRRTGFPHAAADAGSGAISTRLRPPSLAR